MGSCGRKKILNRTQETNCRSILGPLALRISMTLHRPAIRFLLYIRGGSFGCNSNFLSKFYFCVFVNCFRLGIIFSCIVN